MPISAQTFSELAAAIYRREVDAVAAKLNTMTVNELMELNHAAVSLKAVIGNIYHRKAAEYRDEKGLR